MEWRFGRKCAAQGQGYGWVRRLLCHRQNEPLLAKHGLILLNCLLLLLKRRISMNLICTVLPVIILPAVRWSVWNARYLLTQRIWRLNFPLYTSAWALLLDQIDAATSRFRLVRSQGLTQQVLSYDLLAFIVGQNLLRELSGFEGSANIVRWVGLVSLHAQAFDQVQFVCEVCLFGVFLIVAGGVLVGSESWLLADLA